MRLIDADALVDADVLCMTLGGDLAVNVSTINAAPTVDPVEHAQWTHSKGCYSLYVCTACKSEEIAARPYCPHCGRKMDGIAAAEDGGGR